jgi:hypothetical protein
MMWYGKKLRKASVCVLASTVVPYLTLPQMDHYWYCVRTTPLAAH